MPFHYLTLPADIEIIVLLSAFYRESISLTALRSIHKAEFMRLLVSRVPKLLDSASVPVAPESRELNTKLINPKEYLDFLSRCCYREPGRRGGGDGGHGRGRQSIPILECASLGNAASHLYVVAGFTAGVRTRENARKLRVCANSFSRGVCECAFTRGGITNIRGAFYRELFRRE